MDARSIIARKSVFSVMLQVTVSLGLLRVIKCPGKGGGKVGDRPVGLKYEFFFNYFSTIEGC